MAICGSKCQDKNSSPKPQQREGSVGLAVRLQQISDYVRNMRGKKNCSTLWQVSDE